MSTIKDLIRVAKALKACQPALDWLGTLPPRAPAAQAWGACPYWEWLDWFASEVGCLTAVAGFREVTREHWRRKGRSSLVTGDLAHRPRRRPALARAFRSAVPWAEVERAIG